MSRQYFMDTLADPPIADLPAYATVTAESPALWLPSQFTPIPAGDARPGKIYKVTAGGIITLPAVTGTLTITPRLGATTSNANPTLGASGAQFSSGATTNRPWYLEFTAVCRTLVAAGGATSTMMGWGVFLTEGVVTAGGANMVLTIGGTSAVFDASLLQGIGFTVIWGTTAGSITPQFACIQSLT